MNDLFSPGSVVTVSDASEQGAGMCSAERLSRAGREALRVRLGLGAGVHHGAVVLIESFAGLSSTRVALALLGVRCARHSRAS